MKFNPPLPKQKITLSKDWTIDVYNDWHNLELCFLAGLSFDRNKLYTEKLGQYTFPAGTEFEITKVYIRNKGWSEDFLHFKYVLSNPIIVPTQTPGWYNVKPVKIKKFTFRAYLKEVMNLEYV